MDRFERPRFCKVLQPGFLKKLPIPHKFASQYLKSGRSQLVTLFSPLQKFWHVKIEQVGHQFCFGHGWERFAQVHDLAEGQTLILRYEGNMIFSIKVFDLDGSLKEYFRASRFACEPENEVEHQSAIIQQQNTCEDRNERMVDLPSSSSQKTNSSRLPRFERHITYSELRMKFIYVPTRFYQSNNLATRSEMILKDREGREWPFELRFYGGTCRLFPATDLFFLEYGIKENDFCFFELESDGVLQFWKN